MTTPTTTDLTELAELDDLYARYQAGDATRDELYAKVNEVLRRAADEDRPAQP
jgi:hypothetical protein